MKKTFYIILFLIVSSSTLNAATLDRFAVQNQNLSGSTVLISATNPTPIIIEYTLSRGYYPYGYGKVNWIVSVVAWSPGAADIILSNPITLTDAVMPSSPFFSGTINASVVPGNRFAGGVWYIKLKYEAFTFDNNGNLINNLRITQYSTAGYGYSFNSGSSTQPVGYNVPDLKLFSSNIAPVAGSLRKISFNSGGYLNYSSGWANIEGITSLGGYLYISQAGTLHKVNPENADYAILGGIGDWNGTEAITSSSNGYIYIVQNSRIHKVNATSGAFAVIGDPVWGGTSSMVAYGGYLFVMQGEYLHKVDENTGAYTLISGADWGGTQAMASTGDGWIYIIQDASLHKVSTVDGSFEVLGNQSWGQTNTNGMAYYGGNLYVLQNSRLHRVNKTNGAWGVLGNPDFANCKYLTAL